MNGTEILINQLLKSLGINPESFKQMAGNIGQTVVSSKAQLDRIEAKQDKILKHLGLTAEAEVVYLENLAKQESATK